jgi:hypothetical protein
MSTTPPAGSSGDPSPPTRAANPIAAATTAEVTTPAALPGLQAGVEAEAPGRQVRHDGQLGMAIAFPSPGHAVTVGSLPTSARAIASINALRDEGRLAHPTFDGGSVSIQPTSCSTHALGAAARASGTTPRYMGEHAASAGHAGQFPPERRSLVRRHACPQTGTVSPRATTIPSKTSQTMCPRIMCLIAPSSKRRRHRVQRSARWGSQ